VSPAPPSSASRATRTSVTTDAEGTVTGNTYDKYGSTNPVVRRMMAGFEGALADLFARADPQSLLDVGCGEGVLTHQWAMKMSHPPHRRVVGIDLEDPVLRTAWETRQAPNLEYRVMKAEHLPFEDAEFDVATAIEVLEHVPDPGHTVAEMARVAKSHLLVSVPREPVWRLMNLARGAYIRDFGNTPGHVNHWSKAAFTRLLSRHGTVVEARSPFPWTMLLVRL
jgi:ubiquinone/menaquinone biosynthesis C-methylase UbiE